MGEELKNPDCPECKLLDSIGVARSLINSYHDDKIDITRLPKLARKILRRYREKQGYG